MGLSVLRSGERRRQALRFRPASLESLEGRQLLAASSAVGLVSWNAAMTDSVKTGALLPSISADGRYEVFQAALSDAVSGVNAQQLNVYVRDRLANTTRLVSADPSGTNGGNQMSRNAIISANGRFVVFVSNATNLDPLVNSGNNPRNKSNIYVRDLQSNTTKLVSVNFRGNGPAIGGLSSTFDININPTISADGRFIAWQSDANDVVANDGNARTDVFVRDMQAGVTSVVSAAADGSGSGNSTSNNPIISADGSTIAFTSLASDLDPTVTSPFSYSDYQVYSYNVASRVSTLVSTDLAGTAAGNDTSVFPSLSSDGRLIAFQSWARNLVTTPLNNSISSPDVYVRNMATKTTTLVSVNANGTASGNSSSFSPNISADGTSILFSSLANDLVTNDLDGNDVPSKDVFLRNIVTGKTALVSVNVDGSNSGNNTSDMPNQTYVNAAQQYSGAISANGRFVLFVSQATDLVAGFVKQNDTRFDYDVYLRDMESGTTTLVSRQLGTTTFGGNRGSGTAALTPDGLVVAFQSTSSNMVPKDSNGGVNQTDVFAFAPTATPPPPSNSPVRVSRVQWVFDTRNRQLLRQVVVFFSGDLNRGRAANRANYRLALPGRGGSFDASNARVLRVSSASYDSGRRAVTLTLASGLTLQRNMSVQLRITGQGASGLTDAQGRLIDGDGNGQAGGNATAVLRGTFIRV